MLCRGVQRTSQHSALHNCAILYLSILLSVKIHCSVTTTAWNKKKKNRLAIRIDM